MRGHVLALGVLLGCSGGGPTVGANVDARVVRTDATADVSGGPAACLAPASPAAADGICRCNSDCGAGMICSEESMQGWPMGRCIRTCGTATDCGPGYRCFGSTAVRQCNRLCSTSADCGPARYCFSGSCRFDVCQRDGDCFSGHCDRWRARCAAADAPEPAGRLDGEACLRDDDCRSNICLSGSCALPCSIAAQGCPDGEVCVGGDGNDLGLCYQRCAATTECRGTAQTCDELPDGLGRACL